VLANAYTSLAESALKDKEAWSGVRYNFVMGVHPHNASEYTDEVEAMILEAMEHVSGLCKLQTIDWADSRNSRYA
jgi:hypothetical protein